MRHVTTEDLASKDRAGPCRCVSRAPRRRARRRISPSRRWSTSPAPTH